jgi:hypothetical protein
MMEGSLNTNHPLSMKKNRKTHINQSYFIPTAVQQAMGMPLNLKGYLEKGTPVVVFMNGHGHIEAIANGHGSISDRAGRLREWFALLGPEAVFAVNNAEGGGLILHA